MLKARILTALALLAGLLPSLIWLEQSAWAVLMAVVAGIGAWEWGGFMRLSQMQRRLFGGAVSLACVLATLFCPAVLNPQVPNPVFWVYALATLFWVLAVPLWLRYKWSLGALLPGVLTGILVIVPAWLALVQLRMLGAGALLSILAMVWIADVAAYFAGRRFGKRKLAPTISPGKTWEGVFGAALGVLLYGLVLHQGMASSALPTMLVPVALVAITAVSILGDLFESLLKRQIGLKDSSQVLPGHGGVLDRIDSLTSVLPVAAFFWLLLDRL